MEDRLTSHWAARCASVLQDLQKVKRDHWPNCPRIANEAEDPSPPDFMQSPEHVIIVHVGYVVRSSCILHRRTTPQSTTVDAHVPPLRGLASPDNECSAEPVSAPLNATLIVP